MAAYITKYHISIEIVMGCHYSNHIANQIRKAIRFYILLKNGLGSTTFKIELIFVPRQNPAASCSFKSCTQEDNNAKIFCVSNCLQVWFYAVKSADFA